MERKSKHLVVKDSLRCHSDSETVQSPTEEEDWRDRKARKRQIRKRRHTNSDSEDTSDSDAVDGGDDF